MAAVNKTALPTQVALLYVAVLPATGITALNASGSNAAAVITSVETVVATGWKRLASLMNTKLSRDLSKNRKEILTDDTGTIWLSTIEDIGIDATWFESKNPDALALLTGIVSTTATGTISSGTIIATRELPRLITKIVTVADSAGKFDVYYLIDSSVDGTLLTSFLKYDGSFEGSNIKFNMNRGGTFVQSLQTYV